MALMHCSACAHENPPEARFCQRCGGALAATDTACESCGTALPSEARFCHACGTSRTAPATARGEAERQPIDYTPRHLAERILRSRSALEGERKQVTVLLADVKSSMTLSEELDPEEWHRVLERFFELLADGVHRFEGTVNQYTGDGIMALFGAPLAHEDHAQRACWAALHLRDALRAYADELRLGAGLNLSVRLGLNSGEVVVGKIGDDLRMDYTAQGHTVGLAQRMEQLAESGSVYLTDRTGRLVEGWFALRDLGPSKVKGASEPVTVYELEGIGPLRSRFELSRARGLSRFVGRGDELEALEAALERAEAGEGSVIGIVAEAGTGKSRLCFEFAERCRARRIPVRQAQALSHATRTPFLPILQLLRETFEIHDRDEPGAARQKIAGAVVLTTPELEPELPLLFDFLGVPDPERPAQELSSEERQRRLLAAVQQLIQNRSQRTAGVIVIEDLHWIDAASEAFLSRAVHAAEQSRTVLVLNYRPEYHPSWMQGANFQQLPLRALGPEDAGDLLHTLLGADDSVAPLRARVAQRTRGNPFFIEEMVRNLAEAGYLEGEPGAYRLAREPGDELLPESVHSLLAARIDRLEESAKHVLHAAAVIGDRFDEPLLAATLERPADELAAELHSLVAADLLAEESLYPVRELAFRHPLTGEVARRTQLRERRARLHAAVARALEERHPDEPGPGAAVLAEHWEAAGDALRAARWHRHAARFSGLRMAAETFRHWERVRALSGEAPASNDADELGAEARAQLLLAGARIGADEASMQALYDEGMALAERAGHRATMGWLLTARANYLHQTKGWVEKVLPDLRRAIEIADEVDDPGLQLVARYHLVLPTVAQRLSVALEMVGDLRARAEQLPGSSDLLGLPVRPFLLWLETSVLNWSGRIADAEAVVEQLGDAAEEEGSPFSKHQYIAARTAVAIARGDAAAAREGAALTAELGQSYTATAPKLMALSSQGGAHALSGDWEAAAECHGQALATIRRIGAVRNFEIQPLTNLARALAESGRAEEALALADEGAALAEERGPLWAATAQQARAWALLRLEDAAAAPAIEAAVTEAERLSDEVGAAQLRTECREIRAELAGLLGDASARDRWLSEAEQRYAERGASGHARRLAGLRNA